MITLRQLLSKGRASVFARGRGQVDKCRVFDVSGWAVGADGRPRIPEVFVNGRSVAGVLTRVFRQDLDDQGVDPTAGFMFTFDDPIAGSDIVHLELQGSALAGSPLSPDLSGVRLDFEGVSSAEAIVRFERRPPGAQTAVDVFRHRWACNLEPLLGVTGTGESELFLRDDRPELAVRALGRSDLAGMTVLEIGPLEGAHTRKLEQLGASAVTAVESSVEAWLKCLVVKEVLGLERSRFLLGDATEYLEQAPQRFDLVFCSGVFYHLEDPVRLIRGIAGVTDECFVWTHVYDPDRHPVRFEPSVINADGLEVTYLRHAYGSKVHQHWGGHGKGAAWLTQADLLKSFRHFGLTEIEHATDFPDHVNGPSMSFLARRRRPGDA